MPSLLSLYHAMPYPFKCIAASLKGYQLKRWRYGAETEELVQAALERETWSPQRWESWRSERLAYILYRARKLVPYYRDYWDKQERNGKRRAWQYLENWPILMKETVRNNPKAFIADDSRHKRLFVDHTGGTTGKPTLIYESRNSIMRWYALFDARIRRWYGATYEEKWGMFGGQKVVSLTQDVPPYWVKNIGLNQMYFSVFHITSETAKYYVNALARFAPSYLVVYPSILAVLSHHILAQKLVPPKLKAIFCNSEKVLPRHRKAMESAFHCPVVDTYGMAEMSSAASECEAGIMHEWPEVGYLEVFNGETGEFVKNCDEAGTYIMTGLLNEDMPLIRYANGDFGTLPDENSKCACGRSLPKFGVIHGREKDLIQTLDGRRLRMLDSLYNGLPIVEAQLIQESIGRIKVILVPEISFSKEDSQLLVHRIQQYLGDIQVVIDEVKRIPRDKNGKFRPYISTVESIV